MTQCAMQLKLMFCPECHQITWHLLVLEKTWECMLCRTK